MPNFFQTSLRHFKFLIGSCKNVSGANQVSDLEPTCKQPTTRKPKTIFVNKIKLEKFYDDDVQVVTNYSIISDSPMIIVQQFLYIKYMCI